MDSDRLSFYLYRFPQLTKFEKTKVMEKQKTAVEYFEDQLMYNSESNHYFICSGDLNRVFSEAKQMEKEQMRVVWETAHQAGRLEGKGIAEENWQTFDDYYSEEYENKAENND